jgi:rhamnulose-1-phosphate aldolase
MDKALYISKSETESGLWRELNNIESFHRTIKQLADIGHRIWIKGWAEGCSGNVSVRLDSNTSNVLNEFVANSNSLQEQIEHQSFFIKQWYLVSISGSRFRDYKEKGLELFTLVGTTNMKTTNGDVGYITISENRKPTSEWDTHISMHTRLLQENRKANVLMHVHDTDWMVLSSLPEYSTKKEIIVEELYKQLPELKYYLKNGISLLQYREPGSRELAKLSEAAIINKDCLVWERHGVIVAAGDVETAFDYLELLNKAALIYLKRKIIGC